MGVKSTIQLTRSEAEEKFIDLWMDANRRSIKAKAVAMENRELEDIVMQMDDQRSGGESFNNYLIISDE